jgi:hypothetical protein
MDLPHLDVGPLYCETPLTVVSGFPVEFVNSLTSLIPSLFGLFAIIWLVQKRNKRPDLWALAVLTIATGLGSAWWHGARTSVSLAFDVFPGLLYFLLILFLWPAYLFGRNYGALLFAAFFGALFLLARFIPFGDHNGPPAGLFGTVFVFAVAYLWYSYKKIGTQVWWGIAMIAAALAAAFFRTIDLYTCDVLPIGTHFLWHVFLGWAAYLGVVFLAQFSESRKKFLGIF